MGTIAPPVAAGDSAPSPITPSGQALTRLEAFTKDLLRRRGIDVRPDNADEWLPHGDETPRRNAMGNQIGDREHHRKHPGR